MGSTVLSRRAITFPRWPLALALAVFALAVAASTARAGGVIQIGGQIVDLSQLHPDVNRTYSNVAPPLGIPGTVTVTGGYSFGMIIAHLKGLPAFQSVEISAPSGPPIVLSAAQAASPGAYSGGAPVIWDDGAGVHFLVPSSPGGTTNAGETFSVPTLTVTLHHGAALYPGIFGARGFVGQPVQFNSTVGGSGGSLLYQWSFGDGGASSEANPSHTYAATGTYNVYLQVNGSADSVGASSVIHVVVGTPPPRPSAAGTAGAGLGTGSGSGSGAGTGSGSGVGAGTPATTAAVTAPPSPRRRIPSKRTPHVVKKPPRPTGPLVSGIAISYVNQAGATGGGSGGAAGAARAARIEATARGLRYGMWIWFGVLVALFAGGLLELGGPWRAAPPTPVKR